MKGTGRPHGWSSVALGDVDYPKMDVVWLLTIAPQAINLHWYLRVELSRVPGANRLVQTECRKAYPMAILRFTPIANEPIL